MEFKRNADRLMSRVRVDEELYERIMEGRDMKNRKRTLWKRAAVPAAAAILAMSTMYVGAGYLMEHTSLRDLFIARDEEFMPAMPVPEVQQRPDIYEDILDSDPAASGGAASGSAENIAAGATMPLGNFGEKIIDNEYFSIELLEMTCTGRELSMSYILTKKTDRLVSVSVEVDTDYLKRWREAGADDKLDTDSMGMRSGFGDSFRWDKLPEGCGYELAENQSLHIWTQLGKEEYTPGTYTFYADAILSEESRAAAPVAAEGEGSFLIAEEEDPESLYFTAPIEIMGNAGYGLALSGATDKTEGRVHFDRYDIYISPMTVYLTLEGTYEGEISSTWDAYGSHTITIGFADGTQTQTTVWKSAMGYGKGELDVDMRALFETAVDPDSITKVMLDDVVIMDAGK